MTRMRGAVAATDKSDDRGDAYNQAVQAAERMRLPIDRLFATGGVVGHSTV